MRSIKLAVVVLGVGVTGGLVGASGSGQDATPIEELIPALSSPTSKTDIPPATLGLRSLNVPDDAVIRNLGSDSLAEYWVTVADDEVCLIADINTHAESAASGCSPLPAFKREGLSLNAYSHVDGDTIEVEAHLVPGDVEISPDLSDLHASRGLQPGLITFDPRLETLETTHLYRTNGGTFELTPVEVPDA
ncbi:hypothetical protein [Serinibacter salmoneus]|uniref:hypothetical protein n=1 Tax=Serinibacter salmoneus TaxID=556530 RepID=UPI00117AA25B|nr:hypothetical protein [Serinibacter salmoneus]